MNLRAAAVQMNSSGEVAANLKRAGALVDQAAGEGAQLVALPENFSLMQESRDDLLAAAEKPGAGAAQDFLAAGAARNKIWLIGGSIPLRCKERGKVRSACLVYAPDGSPARRYDKIHLFDVRLTAAEGYRESDYIAPGEVEVCTVDAAGVCVGLSICYDLRFPEMFRALGKLGAHVATVPSAFTLTTGRAHWRTLLCARAVENLIFVIAPAQSGRHSNGRRTYGHSMIVGPWGEALAEQAEGEGVLSATLDLGAQQKLRENFPVIAHRRLV